MLDVAYVSAELNRRFLKVEPVTDSLLIVGGGPSVLSMRESWSAFDKAIITNAACYLESVAALRAKAIAGVMLDSELLRRRLRNCSLRRNYPVFVGNGPDDNETLRAILESLDIFIIPSNHTDGFGECFADFVNGGNSGFAAIQLGFLMGFRRFALIGFDGPECSALRYHEDYAGFDRDRQHVERALGQWGAAMQRLRGLLDHVGASIVYLRPEVGVVHGFPAGPAEYALSVLNGRALKFSNADVVATHNPRIQRPPSDYYYPSRDGCFAGAVNAARGPRYCPLPRGIAYGPHADPGWEISNGRHVEAYEILEAAFTDMVTSGSIKVFWPEEWEAESQHPGGLRRWFACAVVHDSEGRPPVAARGFRRARAWRLSSGEVMTMFARSEDTEKCELEPLRIFIGAEPRMDCALQALVYSILATTPGPLDIKVMHRQLWPEAFAGWSLGRQSGMRPRGGRDGAWYTDFSGFRWAVPELCDFEGRAIYLDVDTLVLRNLREMDAVESGGIGLAHPRETSVMAMNCSYFGPLRDSGVWPSIDSMKRSGFGALDGLDKIEEVMRCSIGASWNCLDGDGFRPGDTGVLHFTRMDTQPWRPYPDQIAYRTHPRKDLEDLWFKVSMRANTASIGIAKWLRKDVHHKVHSIKS